MPASAGRRQRSRIPRLMSGHPPRPFCPACRRSRIAAGRPDPPRSRCHRKVLCRRTIRQSAATWCRRARRRTVRRGAATSRRARRPRRITAMPSGPPNTRVVRIVFGHFGFQLGTVGNIGRVGHQQVDPAVEIRQQAGFGDVGRDEFDGRCRRRCGARSPAPRRSRRRAMTAASGRCRASATASAPRPGAQVDDDRVTLRLERCAVAHSSMDSVSGRGMNTPGPTCSISGPNGGDSGQMLQRHPLRPGVDHVPGSGPKKSSR